MSATEPPAARPPRPITPSPTEPVARPLLTQCWLDVTFLHWAADPDEVADALPPGTAPDTFEGVTPVGLVAFRMRRTGCWGLPGLPYLGSFLETNVRLYSVDGDGRRDVVFRSLDASRLLPAAVGRAAFRLPYRWSRMRLRKSGSGATAGAGDTVRYTSHRRWPGPRGAHSRLTVRVGERLDAPSASEDFLTARWGLHSTIAGGLRHLPNSHPRWPLYRAELLECREDLIAAAGLTPPVGAPFSVLFSPGVPVRFGRPLRARPAAPRPGGSQGVPPQPALPSEGPAPGPP